MASSKKTGSSNGKSAKGKAAENNIEDAVIVESDTATDTASDTAPEKDVDAKPLDAVEADETSVEETPGVEEKPEEAAQSDVEPEEAAKEPVVAQSAPAPEPERKSTFFPLVLGGVVAGALGFMASEYDVFGSADAEIPTKLRNDLSAQQERIAALETAEPPAVETPEVDLAPIETQLTELQERIVALEERPVVSVPEGVDGDAVAAYTAELEALKASAEAQRSEIEALINNAKTVEEATAEAAKAASAQAAIAKIVSAIDAGQPYPDAVATLSDLDLGELDPVLEASADAGVATLSNLQAEFPEQARKALATARATGAEDGQQGLGSFLTRALGARSVEPREGDDPDAVLSRAEAAIKSGDLPATLTELDTLPEEAQAAISDWRAAADARVAVRAAADALAQRLTAD